MATLLAVAGDLHVNGTTALCPPTVELDDGGTYGASKAQLWIWQQWQDFWARAEQLKAQHNAECVTILTGELADDNYHNTSQLISKNIEDQARASLAALEPVQRIADRIYVTRGSEAHSGMNSSTDEKLAKAIGAIPDGEGNYARWVFRGVVDGVRIDAAHHPGTGHARPWTKGADANRLAQMVMNPYVAAEMKVPHLAIRGHNHKSSDSAHNHPTRAIILPSWQLPTSFAYRIGAGAFPLPIGGLLMIVENGRVLLEEQRFYDWPVSAWEAA